MKFGSNPQFQQLQAIDFRFQVLAGGGPATPVEGMGYYDSTAGVKTLMIHDSTAFVGLSKVGHTHVAANITDLATVVQAYRLDQFAVPTADLNINSRKLTNVADPTANQDAATKAYVDAARAGLSYKDPVRAAATTNIALTGTQTIDGVAVVAGDRVLVAGQTTASQNGIYVVAAGAWTRATDADANAEVAPGMATFVSEGTSNGNKRFVLITDAPITVGTTSLSFTPDSSAGASYTGSNVNAGGVGVFKQLSGTTFQFNGINAGSNKITITADAANNEIDIDVAEGNLNLANMGGTLTIGKGGTGNITAAAARGTGGLGAQTAPTAATNVVPTAAGIPTKVTATITHTGAATSFTITHNLGTQNVVVMVTDNASPRSMWLVDVNITDANTVTIVYSQALPNTTVHNVTIIG